VVLVALAARVKKGGGGGEGEGALVALVSAGILVEDVSAYNVERRVTRKSKASER
jgi:hypothetical protein